MPWIEDVRRIVELQEPVFTIDDLRPFYPGLKDAHPANHHVEEKVRQMLQNLVATGELQRLELGTYQRTGSPAVRQWPFSPGSRTTRRVLAEVLGMDGIQGLNRGMFKLAQGPHNRDLLLFQQANSPYDDEETQDQRVLYVGMGQIKHGDQKWEGMNRYLGEHLERGITPHLFRQVAAKSSELEYVGEFLCEEVRETYVEDEERRVFQFQLAPVAFMHGLVADFASTFVRMKEEPRLQPYLEQRRQVMSRTRRMCRDRAFAAVLVDAYKRRCAVCGTALARGKYVDLQGAHVRPVAEKGPDEINNGLCLCARHHWAFDRGVFSLTDNHSIIVHRDAGEDPHGELVSGEGIEIPTETSLAPHADYLSFHRRTFAFT